MTIQRSKKNMAIQRSKKNMAIQRSKKNHAIQRSKNKNMAITVTKPKMGEHSKRPVYCFTKALMQNLYLKIYLAHLNKSFLKTLYMY